MLSEHSNRGMPHARSLLFSETQRPGLTQGFQKLGFIGAPGSSWFFKGCYYSHNLPLFAVRNLCEMVNSWRIETS